MKLSLILLVTLALLAVTNVEGIDTEDNVAVDSADNRLIHEVRSRPTRPSHHSRSSKATTKRRGNANSVFRQSFFGRQRQLCGSGSLLAVVTSAATHRLFG